MTEQIDEHEPSVMHYPAFDENEDDVEHRHIITIVARDRVGTMARVVGLFSARSYNIDSIAASNIDKEHELSSIVIITHGTNRVIKQIKNQLERLINVFYVTDVTGSKDRVLRELALIKVRVAGKRRLEVLTIANSFHANVVEAMDDTIIIEMVGAPQKVNTFIDILRPLGVIDVVKSGPAGMINTIDSPVEDIIKGDLEQIRKQTGE